MSINIKRFDNTVTVTAYTCFTTMSMLQWFCSRSFATKIQAKYIM